MVEEAKEYEKALEQYERDLNEMMAEDAVHEIRWRHHGPCEGCARTIAKRNRSMKIMGMIIDTVILVFVLGSITMFFMGALCLYEKAPYCLPMRGNIALVVVGGVFLILCIIPVVLRARIGCSK